LNYGQFGLKALEPERITARQIEAARRALTRHMRRAGCVWIRIFPDVRCRKSQLKSAWAGQGHPEFWAWQGRTGRIMFELDGAGWCRPGSALLAAAKLPIKTRFIERIVE
jgi:large subunit ribosomal protein L16